MYRSVSFFIIVVNIIVYIIYLRNQIFLLFIFAEPCEVSSYKMQTREYDSRRIITGKINERLKQMINITVPNNTKTFSMVISFLKTDIDLTEEISLYSFFHFISSVGGNLGLFTGFSVLATLLTFIEWLHKIITK